MLDVRRLRLLHELSMRGTIAEVGEALHLSPSSVSQQLSQLEREVGVDLLIKVGRRLQLTPAAEVLVEHARAVLDRLEQAEADVAALGGQASGSIRIAAFQSATHAFVPRLLTELARAHPRLRVTVSQRVPEEGIRETAARDFDLVIAEQYPHQAAPRPVELDRVPLTTDALRLAVPLGGDWDTVSGVKDVAAVPWVMEPSGAASRQWAVQLCRDAGFEPDIRFEADDLQTQIALIEAGQAVAILPELMLLRRHAQVRLIDLPGRPRRSVFTATRTSLAATTAIRACRETLAAIVPTVLAPDRRADS